MCLSVSFASSVSTAFPDEHCPSTVSFPLPKLLAMFSHPSLFFCDSQSCSLHLSFLFLWYSTPPLVFISILLFQLICFFCSAPYSTFLPCPRIVYFLCLAYSGPLILFLVPVSVQVCKVISAEEQTGFCSRKCWTIQGVGGAHSTTYNLEQCLYF